MSTTNENEKIHFGTNCFEFFFQAGKVGLYPGIRVDTRGKQAGVFLGSKKTNRYRKSSLHIVGFDNEGPKSYIGGDGNLRIYRAIFRKIPVGRKVYRVISSAKDDRRMKLGFKRPILLRINTFGVNRYQDEGTVEVLKGEPTLVGKGTTSIGNKPKQRSCADAIYQMNFGDKLKVRVAGVDVFVVEHTGELYPKFTRWIDFTKGSVIRRNFNRKIRSLMAPALSFRGGELHQGIVLASGKDGMGLILGPSGKNQRQIPNFSAQETENGYVNNAGLISLGLEEHYLVKLETWEQDGYLVRVQTFSGYGKNYQNGNVEPFRGKPVRLLAAFGRSGFSSFEDSFWFLKSGDVLRVYMHDANSSQFAIYVAKEVINSMPWHEFERMKKKNKNLF